MSCYQGIRLGENNLFWTALFQVPLKALADKFNARTDNFKKSKQDQQKWFSFLNLNFNAMD